MTDTLQVAIVNSDNVVTNCIVIPKDMGLDALGNESLFLFEDNVRKLLKDASIKAIPLPMSDFAVTYQRAHGIGSTWDPVNKFFYGQQPFPSWTLSVEAKGWEAPTPRPADDKPYRWNEEQQSWDVVDVTASQP